MRIGSRQSRGRLVAAIALLQFGFVYSTSSSSSTYSSSSISPTASPQLEASPTSSTGSEQATQSAKGPANSTGIGSTPSPSPSPSTPGGNDDVNQAEPNNVEDSGGNRGVDFEFKWMPYLFDVVENKGVASPWANAAVIRTDVEWQLISWGAGSKKIAQLKLYKRKDLKAWDLIAHTQPANGGLLEGFVVPPGVPQVLKDTKALVEKQPDQRRQTGSRPLFTVSLASDGSGNITFLNQIDVLTQMLQTVSPIRTDLLFFEAVLQGNEGSSYSRWFALTTSPAEWLAVVETPELSVDKPALRENITQSAQEPSTTTSREGSPQSTSAPSASASESGLPTGAKIGIAVGAGVAGLLILIVLVWLAVRWRRKRKNLVSVGSYGPNGRADELMAQKEASAGVDAPHSPYSDDGEASGSGSGYRDRSGVAAAAVVASHHQHQHSLDHSRSSTPFLDRPSSRPGGGPGTPSVRAASVAHTESEIPRTTMASPIPGRATPRALTTPYAHLVEEGMTEEEIRRLEEEERQLDAAIEQAGRR